MRFKNGDLVEVISLEGSNLTGSPRVGELLTIQHEAISKNGFKRYRVESESKGSLFGYIDENCIKHYSNIKEESVMI